MSVILNNQRQLFSLDTLNKECSYMGCLPENVNIQQYIKENPNVHRMEIPSGYVELHN